MNINESKSNAVPIKKSKIPQLKYEIRKIIARECASQCDSVSKENKHT